MNQREDFIALALLPGANISELCRRFGISRQTGHQCLARYRQGGTPALAERSRRPKNSPGQAPPSAVRALLALRASQPTWGPRKLRRRLQDLGHSDLPARSTIGAILRREGQISARASEAATPWRRFERAAPNALWQMDFKGHFALGDATRCHALTVLDDHSRYLVGLQACAGQRSEVVQGHLERIFRTHGLPESILCDNGSPWRHSGGDGYTLLSVWLMLLGVGLCHGRPFHPQTQGKDERFHRTLKADLLARQDFASVAHAQPHFDAFRRLYNHDRPHQALGDAVPASRYVSSPRHWRTPARSFDYAPGAVVRTVRAKGEITFQNRFFYLGVAFRTQTVGLEATAAEGLYDVRFHAYRIGQIDLRVPNSKPKGHYYLMAKPTDLA